MASGSSLLTIIKFIIKVYDLLTAWVYSLWSNSGAKVRNFSRTRALPTSPVREGDTQVTYEPVQPSKKSPIINEFESSGIKTMDEVFRWSVNRYGARRFLGTRDILGEDDEVQPNGRIFAKLELGDYRLIFKTQTGRKLIVSAQVDELRGGGHHRL